MNDLCLVVIIAVGVVAFVAGLAVAAIIAWVNSWDIFG